VQVARRRRREPDSHTVLCFISHFVMLLALPALSFQTSSLAKPRYGVQCSSRSAQNERHQPRDTAVVLPEVYGNRYPHPTASFATGTPVRLLSQFSIIHNHRYFVLCTEVGPCAAAWLSPRVSPGGSFHLEAQSASPWLHGVTEPSARGTEN
jgi:hypothetical protein